MPQSTDTDKSQKLQKNEEECINFRPSPNFKHMKKYLKSKFEETANQIALNGSMEPQKTQDQMEATKPTPTVVQPPLPPNPPPPDDPPLLVLKKEIEDDEYECGISEDTTDIIISKHIITEKTDSSEPDNPKKTMCRNFIRGTCKRGPSCIFAHKLILSQLPGVYTFCKNFQNSVCTYAKCKFVHATVFEKEYFFRTGYLPPHTMSHLKEVNVLQPPPPPPPEETVPVVPPIFTNPPPPPVHSGVTPIPVATCAPTANIEVRTDVFRGALASSTSPQKREWSDSDGFSSSPRDLDSSEPLAKKCKNCDNNEFRFQYNKVKVKKMMRNSEEMNKKIALVTKKTNKLYTVLVTVLKSLKSTNGSNGINNLLDLGEDKEKAFLEQLNLFLAANNRLSIINEDSGKNLISNNFSNILAKHLLSSVDPKLSPDAS